MVRSSRLPGSNSRFNSSVPFISAMSSSGKKRKDALPEHTAAEVAQKASRMIEQPSQTMPDSCDDGGGDDSTKMRIQRDEAEAKLAAALLKIERLETGRDAELAAALLKIERFEAAASEPCARCNFYSDWTVRVRTMSGQVHTIACPDGPKTLVAHVKQKLAQFDPKCHILQQITLVLPCEASSSSSADPIDPALADDRTLESYGLSKRDVLDLFLVDMNWSDECLQMIGRIKDCGEEVRFTTVIDDDLALALSWALVNAVCFDAASEICQASIHLYIVSRSYRAASMCFCHDNLAF